MLERDLATVRSSRGFNVALPIGDRRSSPVIGAVPIEPQNRNQAIKTRVQSQTEIWRWQEIERWMNVETRGWGVPRHSYWRESVDSSIAFFFGVMKTPLYRRREGRRLFWKKEARRYVAFLSSTGTLPVPLPLPRDCPASREIGGWKLRVSFTARMLNEERYHSEFRYLSTKK